MWPTRCSQIGAGACDVAGTETGGRGLAPWVASMCDRDVGRAPRYGSTAVRRRADAMADVAIAPFARCLFEAPVRAMLSRDDPLLMFRVAVDRGPGAAFESALHIGRCEAGARQHQRDASQHTPGSPFRQTRPRRPELWPAPVAGNTMGPRVSKGNAFSTH